MNLNHIAKKPFFDLFYAKPCMAAMLRSAIYDASFLNADGSARGPRGSMLLQSQQKIIKSKEIKETVAHIEEIGMQGNHITAELTYTDLI